MDLKGLLKILQSVADEHKIHTPYIVGGVPRNILLNNFESLNDVDITTGHKDVHKLADLFAERMNVTPKVFEDGHRRLYIDEFQLDFSSHAIYPGLQEYLKDRDLTPLEEDAFSRDFTANSLMIPLDFSTILDPTGQGLEDIKNKILRCPINCDIIFHESPNRIIRAFYYAAKYDLKLSDDIKNSIKSNIELLDTVKGKYSSKKIAEAIRLSPDILDDLIETGVLGRIPLTKDVVNILVKQKKLNKVL